MKDVSNLFALLNNRRLFVFKCEFYLSIHSWPIEV